MGFPPNWPHLPEPWNWLSPSSLILGVLGWLGRRRGWFRWADAQFDARRRLASVENTLALREQEIAALIETNTRLLAALGMVTDAGAAVVQAQAEDRLTISSGSSPGPLPLPASSTGSRRRRRPAKRATP